MPDAVSTSNIWPYYSSQNVQKATRQPSNELGKDQFLQILITQLRNQDPLQPLQNHEFIAQMAQFSALEQTMNMAKELAALRQSAGFASGLIGKTVEWVEDTESGVEKRSGIVEAIVRRDGIQYVKVGQSEVKIDDLLTISDGSQPGSEDAAPEGENAGNE
mgnify:CR=1 FL=1|jgi:flagellar basal-body rod modification protein FlgD